MLYVLAIILSFVFCAQGLASEVMASNITHLKNGRQPNAGASIFPVVPIVQFLAGGGAWFLKTFSPHYAIWILIGSFLIFSAFWAFSFAKLRAEFIRIQKP